MRKSKLLFVAVSIASSLSVHAEQEKPIEIMMQNVEMNIRANCAQLGLTEQQYKFAIDQFLRLHSGATSLPQIMDIPEFRSPENYTDIELAKAMNIQKASLATYLSIPIDRVDDFIAATSQQLGEDFVDYVNRERLTAQ